MGESAKFVINEKGERVGVFLDIEMYNRFLEAMEELDDIRAYDEAVASNEKPIPFQQATDEIERSRK